MGSPVRWRHLGLAQEAGAISIPDRLAYTRMVLVPAIVALVLLEDHLGCAYWIAAGLMVAASFSDWLDGFLARRWHITSTLGAFLDTIADKIKESIDKYGPSSIAVSQGTGRGYNRYTHRFARSIGTANIITPGYVCHSPRIGLYGLVTGYGRLYCDYHGWGGEFPKTQISWAKQLEISSADSEMAVWYLNSLRHVKNLIVIDPRETALSSRATLSTARALPPT